MATPLTGWSRLATNALVKVGELANRTIVLPVVICFLTSRCNSRCVSCDWWKSAGADDLTLKEIEGVADALVPLGTRLVVFSGGEPLLRPEVFEAAAMFRGRGMALHLLTSGVLLERSASDVARWFSRVIVSLDAPTEELYRAIRGVAALTTIERGVARLQRLAPDVLVTARATVHRMNFRELPRLIEHAKAMALDGISFLPADVSSTAFGRESPDRSASLTLGAAQIGEFADLVDEIIADRPDDFASGFIQESPEKLRRLPQYYAALAGLAQFPPVSCNAPHVSVVIEADGAVRPCFFHQTIGSIRREGLDSIVTRNLRAFRADWSADTNPVCSRCVCSIRTGWRSAPWP
jgi:Fe-coproporphyrin III synthase